MGKTRRTGDLVTDNNLYVNPTDDSFHVGTGITMYGGSVGIISATSFYASGNINANGNIVGDTSTNVSGINSVTATSFHGDGSNLSGVGGVTTGKAIAMAMVFG